MQRQGTGSLFEKYNALLAQLREKGYFDDAAKKPIPYLPASVALVTSPTGAAVRDMISVISRRCPSCRIIVCPAQVQGTGASREIAAVIDYVNEQNLAELIIVGRGGGSVEELWAFNERDVAESVFRSHIPVISAVGHETDFTICDFVADMRAPTPSAAAELAVPDVGDLNFTLNKYTAALKERLISAVRNRRARLDLLCKTRAFSEPRLSYENKRMYLNALAGSLKDGVCRTVGARRERLESKNMLLNSLSYEKVLARGYCVLEKDGRLVKEADVCAGDDVDVVSEKKILHVKVDHISERSTTNGGI
jgi:exodeoxyribonuclease VII large subunit